MRSSHEINLLHLIKPCPSAERHLALLPEHESYTYSVFQCRNCPPAVFLQGPVLTLQGVIYAWCPSAFYTHAFPKFCKYCKRLDLQASFLGGTWQRWISRCCYFHFRHEVQLTGRSPVTFYGDVCSSLWNTKFA